MAMVTVADLKKGESAVIQEINPNPIFGGIDSILSQRLYALGFTPKSKITLIARGFLGSPIAIRLENRSQFSLRKQEAKKIKCELISLTSTVVELNSCEQHSV